jgi:hypothetical protein
MFLGYRFWHLIGELKNPVNFMNLEDKLYQLLHELTKSLVPSLQAVLMINEQSSFID